jgi:hypothetical protein
MVKCPTVRLPNLPTAGCKSQTESELRQGGFSVAQPVAQETGKSTISSTRELAAIDPDLAAILNAWPTLPVAIRAGVLAMVKAGGR